MQKTENISNDKQIKVSIVIWFQSRFYIIKNFADWVDYHCYKTAYESEHCGFKARKCIKKYFGY